MRHVPIVEWVKELDGILRGQATRPELLQAGTIQVRVTALVGILIVLAVLCGLFTGSYAIFGHEEPMYMQVLADAVKVPILFFLTLLVTFPSLYVFNALVGARLQIDLLLRVLLASMAATLALLASFGPIVVFFSVCTTNYPFMVLLNVLAYGAAGLVGLKFLLQALHRAGAPEDEPVNPKAPGAPPEGRTAPEGTRDVQLPPGGPPRPTVHRSSTRIKLVSRVWVAVFALVGAQMGWILRPFIGSPRAPFEWFREREANVFVAVWGALTDLLRG